MAPPARLKPRSRDRIRRELLRELVGRRREQQRIVAEEIDRQQARVRALCPELESAERFLRHVLRELPWGDPQRESTKLPELDRSRAAADLTLAINHKSLRECLQRHHQQSAYFWRAFTESVADGVLEDYKRGTIDREAAILAVWRCIEACAVDRYGASAIIRVVKQASNIPPRTLNAKRPRYAPWVETVTVTIARVLAIENPGVRVKAYADGSSSPIQRSVLAWLVTLGVCDERQLMRPKTIDAWIEKRLATRVRGR